MIYVGFSKHKGFSPLSWLIMLCEHSNYSHSYIRVWSDSLECDLIYQATGSGVYFISKGLFDKTSESIEEYEIPVTKEQKTQLLKWAIEQSGKPYGVKQLMGLGLVRLLKLFGIKIKNPFSDGNSTYICCELVMEALKHLNYKFTESLDDVDFNSIKNIIKQI